LHGHPRNQPSQHDSPFSHRGQDPQQQLSSLANPVGAARGHLSQPPFGKEDPILVTAAAEDYGVLRGSPPVAAQPSTISGDEPTTAEWSASPPAQVAAGQVATREVFSPGNAAYSAYHLQRRTIPAPISAAGVEKRSPMAASAAFLDHSRLPVPNLGPCKGNAGTQSKRTTNKEEDSRHGGIDQWRIRPGSHLRYHPDESSLSVPELSAMQLTSSLSEPERTETRSEASLSETERSETRTESSLSETERSETRPESLAGRPETRSELSLPESGRPEMLPHAPGRSDRRPNSSLSAAGRAHTHPPGDQEGPVIGPVPPTSSGKETYRWFFFDFFNSKVRNKKC
jgi:hypothetical protein